MKKKLEYKVVYRDPGSGETLTWVGGDTEEEVNEDINMLCARNGWNKKYLDIVQEKNPETGKWYWR